MVESSGADIVKKICEVVLPDPADLSTTSVLPVRVFVPSKLTVLRSLYTRFSGSVRVILPEDIIDVELSVIVTVTELPGATWRLTSCKLVVTVADTAGNPGPAPCAGAADLAGDASAI